MSFATLLRRCVDGHPVTETFTASDVAEEVMQADRTLKVFSATRSRASNCLRKLEEDGIVVSDGAGRGPSGIRWRRIADHRDVLGGGDTAVDNDQRDGE